MPHEAVVASPEAQIVEHPCAHRRAVAIGSRHPYLGGLIRVNVATGGAQIQTVALPRIDFGPLLVETEPLHPPGILVDPGVLHTGRRNPLIAAPNIEEKGAVFGGKRRQLCGPSARRGSRSPILTSSKRGEIPIRLDISHSCRTRSTCCSSSCAQRRIGGTWALYMPRRSASAAR